MPRSRRTCGRGYESARVEIREAQTSSAAAFLLHPSARAVEKLARELKFPIITHDEKLFEVALALDDHQVAGLFRGDRLHLDPFCRDGAVRPVPMRAMPVQAELDLRIDLSQLTPDLQVAPGVLKMTLRAVDQVEKGLGLLDDAVWKSVAALKRRDVLALARTAAVSGRSGTCV